MEQSEIVTKTMLWAQRRQSQENNLGLNTDITLNIVKDVKLKILFQINLI